MPSRAVSVTKRLPCSYVTASSRTLRSYRRRRRHWSETAENGTRQNVSFEVCRGETQYKGTGGYGHSALYGTTVRALGQIANSNLQTRTYEIARMSCWHDVVCAVENYAAVDTSGRGRVSAGPRARAGSVVTRPRGGSGTRNGARAAPKADRVQAVTERRVPRAVLRVTCWTRAVKRVGRTNVVVV